MHEEEMIRLVNSYKASYIQLLARSAIKIMAVIIVQS
jgi:hypothetical protein